MCDEKSEWKASCVVVVDSAQLWEGRVQTTLPHDSRVNSCFREKDKRQTSGLFLVSK